jgi:hypothetical protein
MAKSIPKAAALVLATSLASATALAQLHSSPIPELEIDGLVDNGMVGAQILEVDGDARTLTVQFDENDETARVVVPEGAEIFETGPNDLEHRINLDELNAGDNVMLQTLVVEDVIRLRIIGVAS